MQCPFLSGKYMLSCSAQKKGYVPSVFEMEEYCTKTLHAMCPVFIHRTMDNCEQVVDSAMAHV